MDAVHVCHFGGEDHLFCVCDEEVTMMGLLTSVVSARFDPLILPQQLLDLTPVETILTHEEEETLLILQESGHLTFCHLGMLVRTDVLEGLYSPATVLRGERIAYDVYGGRCYLLCYTRAGLEVHHMQGGSATFAFGGECFLQVRLFY